jgi:hypothetical protein
MKAVSCLAYPLTLKMEVALSTKMSADFQGTTQRYIPEDRTLTFRFSVQLLAVCVITFDESDIIFRYAIKVFFIQLK